MYKPGDLGRFLDGNLSDSPPENTKKVKSRKRERVLNPILPKKETAVFESSIEPADNEGRNVEARLLVPRKEEASTINGPKKRKKNRNSDNSAAKTKTDTKPIVADTEALAENGVASIPTRPHRNKLITNSVEENDRTVFVGNLSLKTTEKGLKKVFQSCGAIDSVRFRGIVAENPKLPKRAAFVLKKFHPDAKHINAYVKFKDASSVSKALELNGQVISDRHIRVDQTKSRNQKSLVNKKRSVYIGNIPYAADEEALWPCFEDCGEIEGIRIMRDVDGITGKGFGFVTFKQVSSVSLALKLDGLLFQNRNLRITPVSKEKKPVAGKKAQGSVKLSKVSSQKAAARFGTADSKGSFPKKSNFNPTETDKNTSRQRLPKAVREKLKKKWKKSANDQKKSLLS